MRQTFFNALILLAFLGLETKIQAIPNQVHPNFTMTAVDAKYNNADFLPFVMGLAFLPDGRLLVATSEDLARGGVVLADPVAKPDYSELYIMGGVSGPAAGRTVIKIADAFLGLSGVVVVEGVIYVADRDGFYKLVDSNKDDVIDSRVKIVGWPGAPHWHQWAFTPMYRDNKFYVPWSGTVSMGGASQDTGSSPLSGAFLSFDKDGQNLSALGSGLRSPNGAGMSPMGDIFVIDNEGSWLPASTVSHIKAGKSSGHRHKPERAIDKWTYEPPTAWIPQRTIGLSPSEPVYIPHGTFEGDWLFGDVTHFGLMRMSLDAVKGKYQGAIFPFSAGPVAGADSGAVNRLVWGADSALYIGNVGRMGNWPSKRARFPIYRLKESGVPEFEMASVHSRKGGLEIRFTQPVDPATILNANFYVKQFTYIRMSGYGQIRRPEKDSLKTVTATLISTDKKRVFIQIDGLKDRSDHVHPDLNKKEGYVTYVKLNGVKSATSKAPWNDEVWYTMTSQSESSFSIVPIQSKMLRYKTSVRLEVGSQQLAVTTIEGGAYTVEIKNLMGRTLNKKTGNGPETIYIQRPVSQAGVYLLQVKQGNKSFVQKVFF